MFSLSYSLCVTGEGVPPISEMTNNGHSAQLDISQMGDFSFRCLCVCVSNVSVFVFVLSLCLCLHCLCLQQFGTVPYNIESI